MKPLKKGLGAWQKALMLLLLTMGLLGLAGVVLAAEGVSIDWRVIAGGGDRAVGGEVVLNGTIGQPIIGVSYGSGLSLRAGYWGGLPAMYKVFLPMTAR